MGLSSASDISLLLLALICIAAIAKLGPSRVSCSQFFSMITEISGSLMDMMVGLGMAFVDNWVVGKEEFCYWLSNDIVGLVVRV